ncbi:Uncharacterized protein Y057_10061 [Fusarium fujikuroi]|nr:Uncharacterized protein Y057_10061 [Fusarium fujikuroi]
MDIDQTVFYLSSRNRYASEIIKHPDNSNRTCQDPKDPKKLCLRIGLDQESKSPPFLVSFGRRDQNDVILGKGFPNAQCYFDFNNESGELLLHDISEACDTQLQEIESINNDYEDEDGDGETKEKLGFPQISKTRRRCVVLLGPDLYHDRIEWHFQIRNARFRLIPGPTQLIKELQVKGSLALEPHSTSPKQGSDKVIRFRKLKPLGSGNQGEVHEVVDLDTGTHYACKLVDVMKGATEWKNHTGKCYRARVIWEVEMVRNLMHPHIVPYTHVRELVASPNIQIFMPVYEGNLYNLLEEPRVDGKEGVRNIISQMLYQMLQALDFVHSRNPQIIHRDIKPPNILYRGNNFFLTDFGIAKAVDTSNTVVGTPNYMAPEVREKREQTSKVDIWGLGVTVVACLENPKDFEEEGSRTDGEKWYEYLQKSLSQHHSSSLISMVSVDPDGRPAADELLRQHWPTGATLSSAAAPLSPQPSGTITPVLMDWVSRQMSDLMDNVDSNPEGQRRIFTLFRGEHTFSGLIEWTTAMPKTLEPCLAVVEERLPTDENRPEEARTLVFNHFFNDGPRIGLVYKCVEQPIDLREAITRIPKPSPEHRRALGRTIATQVRSLYVHFQINHPALRTESFIFFVNSDPNLTTPYILDWARLASPEMYQHPEHQAGKPLWSDHVWSLMMVLSEIADWKPLEKEILDHAELRSRKLERKRLVTNPSWKDAMTAEFFQFGFEFLEKDRSTLEEYSRWKVKRFYDRLCKLLEPL